MWYPPPGQIITKPFGDAESARKSSSSGFDTFSTIVMLLSGKALSCASVAVPGILPSGQISIFSDAPAVTAAKTAIAAKNFPIIIPP